MGTTMTHIIVMTISQSETFLMESMEHETSSTVSIIYIYIWNSRKSEK